MAPRHSQKRNGVSKAEMRGSMAWCTKGALVGYAARTESFLGKPQVSGVGTVQISRALHAMLKTLDLVLALLNLTNGRREKN